MGIHKKYKTKEEWKEARRLSLKKWRDANPDRTKENTKKYYDLNKKEMNIKSRLSYSKNKEFILEKARIYRKLNPDKIKEANDKYKKTHKNEIKERKKIYENKNSDKLKKNHRDYYAKNKEICKKRVAIYRKNRCSIDQLFKLTCIIRSVTSKAITNAGYFKNNKTKEILGCSYEEFKLHLESKFESWMNWNNYGNPKDGILELNKTWDIDHIIPLSSAKTEEDIIKLSHYTNLKPLCSKFNRQVKKNKLTF